MAKTKILVVDDEMDVLVLVKTTLEFEGFEVATASNGFDALAAADDYKPDAIILDIMMPEMDGFEVLSHLRQSPGTLNIPVIMLTGLDERLKMKEALDKGVTYYVTKPFDNEALISKVKLAISESGELTP